MEKVEQNKLNFMLDEALSKETTESWNKRLQEEPVSDGLEEAAKKAATQIVRGEEKFFWNDYHKFKAGAKWQREQDMQKGANYVIEEIEKIINHPLKFVNANKTVEDGMIEEISKLVEQLKK